MLEKLRELLSPQVVMDAGMEPTTALVTVMSVFLETDWCRREPQGDSFEVRDGGVWCGDSWLVGEEMAFWRSVNLWLDYADLPDELEAAFWDITREKVS